MLLGQSLLLASVHHLKAQALAMSARVFWAVADGNDHALTWLDQSSRGRDGEPRQRQRFVRNLPQNALL